MLAAGIVVVCGTLVGLLVGGESGQRVATVTQTVTRPGPVQTTTVTRSDADPGEITITPATGPDAPDTLKELLDGDRIEESYLADFGTVTIADKPHEGMSMSVDRGGARLVINTRRRYKQVRGLVGISGDVECPDNDANVSITNGSGETLWAKRVGFTSPTRFEVAITNRSEITLDAVSVPAGDNPCDGDFDAHPAWGSLEFVK